MKPVLLLTKRDVWSTHAGHLAQLFFGKALVWESGPVGAPTPQAFDLPEYSLILSFLSPWIVPEEVLNKSSLSLNFHSGSCEYPGIGCYNFALYEGAKTFGGVCHIMLPKVDSGTVIDESLFTIAPDETVETLKLRTMVCMLAQFHEITAALSRGEELPRGPRHWTCKPFTRKQLNSLCEILPAMDEAEKQRRILSTTYPGFPGPYLLENGKKHLFPVPDRKPLA